MKHGRWRRSTSDGSLRRVVAQDGSPAFSPDGRWLAFVAERNGNQELYKARANGSGLVNAAVCVFALSYSGSHPSR